MPPLTWHVETFYIRTRIGSERVARFGLVSQDGIWGLHLDGEHVGLTHIPTGARVRRFREIGTAASTAGTLSALPIEWNTRKPMIDGPTETHLLTILKAAE